MHSYDNGIAAKAKRDNWMQLSKVFRKIGFPDLLNEGEIHRISIAEDGAAVTFICKIYELLTQRKVQTQVKLPIVGKDPGYARDISVTKVRRALHHNDLGEDSDVQTVTRFAAVVLNDHERLLQEERMLDPERFSTSTISLRQSHAVSKTSTDHEAPMPQIKVKEIQVKQLDRNITHLRATRQTAGPSLSPVNVGGGGQFRAVSPPAIGEHSMGGFGSPESAGPGGPERGDRSDERSVRSRSSVPQQNQGNQLLPENSVSLLNACIARVMGPGSHPGWSGHSDNYHNLVAALDFVRGSADIDSLVAQCFNEIRDSSQMLAEACIVTPKQFWKVSDLFCAVLIGVPNDSASFTAAADCFDSLGRWVTSRDGHTSLALFCDFALFKLADTIVRNSSKRLGILRLLHSFSPADPQAHVQCIKRLQVVIPDLTIFVHCLTILAANESTLDEMLLDLYIYYATIGLGNPNPKLRAGAVAMLATFVSKAEGLIVPMLPQLASLASSETWWEIHAHLLTLCGAMMAVKFAPQGRSPEVDGEGKDDFGVAESVVGILRTILSSTSSRNLLKWGAVALAPGTHAGDPAFNELYVVLLGRLDEPDRRFFLGISVDGGQDGGQAIVSGTQTVRLPTSTGMTFLLRPVSSAWNALQVCKSIQAKVLGAAVKGPAADRLSPLQAQVLRGCFFTPFENARKSGQNVDNILDGSWQSMYSTLKDLVLVGICDPTVVRDAVAIISLLALNSPSKDKIILDQKMTNILRLLYPKEVAEGNEECQEVFEYFLRDVFSAGAPFNSAALSLVSQFAKNSPQQFDKYPALQRLVKEFSSKVR